MYVATTIVFGMFLMGVIPSIRVLLLEHRFRSVWAVEVSASPEGDRGAYRTPSEMKAVRSDGPPTLIRFTAWTCFLFGQMFLPGLLLGLFGLVMFGLGVVSIPGLVLAWKLFRLGGAILRREPEAAGRARDLAMFTVVLNIVVVIACGLVALVVTRGGFIALAVLPYALLSFAHASLLHVAAHRLDVLNGIADEADASATEAVGLAA